MLFLKKLGYLCNEGSYSYHLLSFILFLQELSFGTITLQIRLLVFAYELFMKLFSLAVANLLVPVFMKMSLKSW